MIWENLGRINNKASCRVLDKLQWFDGTSEKPSQQQVAVVKSNQNQIKCIYLALRTSADISKCCTETQPKTPNCKQCRCGSTVARKNSLERPKPRKKPREEPGYVGWPVLFWLCRVEIIKKHCQDVQMIINFLNCHIIGVGQVARPVNRSGG